MHSEVNDSMSRLWGGGVYGERPAYGHPETTVDLEIGTIHMWFLPRFRPVEEVAFYYVMST